MSIEVFEYSGKRIAVRGVAESFYKDGFPLSMTISYLKKEGVEVSYLHLVDDLWNNGWSWKTIKNKFSEEKDLDIENNMSFNIEVLKSFYDLLEQPKRSNGGYEESREMIFQHLFQVTTDSVRKGESKEPVKWFKNTIKNKPLNTNFV